MSSVISALVVAAPQAAGSTATAKQGGRGREAAASEFGPLLARVLAPAGRRGEAAPATDTTATEAVEGEPTASDSTEETAIELLVPATAAAPVSPPAPIVIPAEGTAAPAPAAEGTAGAADAMGAVGVASSAAVPGPAGVAGAGEAGEGVKAAESAEAAGTAAAAAPPANPRKVERGMERLDPEFRTRLGRVVERMRSEHGHEVKLVETLRPQERQDFLFEQGRSRPGPVVTWTRSSNHTLGRAADVLIDGTYSNPAGYSRLAKVAAEEGLRTLGAKDPGHVELPRGARPLPSMAGPLAPVAPEPAGTVGVPVREAAEGSARGTEQGMARVAEVARVADVARVAQVAQVAHPGRISAPEVASRSGADARGRGRSEGGETARSGAEAELLRVDSSASSFAHVSSAAATEPVSSAGGVDAASRLARIMEVRDNAAAGPMGHVLLRVDNGSGGEDLIRVDMRGNTVGANIDVANPAELDQLLARLPDLQRALERHGLETEQLRVRTAASGLRDAAEVAQIVSTLDVESARGGMGGRTGSDSASSRERWENAAHGQSRRDTDDPRQQPRRNPKGENKS